MEILNDEYYMRLALQLASGTPGQTGTNPSVGCVIVKDGRIVGLGSHLQMGGPHAEVHALQMAGAQAENSTVYVTLEPCNHYGRTPPCSEQLIQAKVKRVVAACKDPNPVVAGSGLARLVEHGIEVSSGLLGQQAAELNEAFNKFIVTGMPFVTLKTASTLDGKIASRTRDSKWVTGEAARAYVHTLRHRHQAIMAGVDTIIADDPQLTTRLAVPALDPIRIVVDSQLRIPTEAKLIQSNPEQTMIITTERAADGRSKELEQLGVKLLVCGAGPRVDLRLAMRRLGEMGIGSVLLEGGGKLNGAMLECGLIDKMILFYAPKIIGGDSAPANFSFGGFDTMSEAIELTRVNVEMIGQDICLTGYPVIKSGKE